MSTQCTVRTWPTHAASGGERPIFVYEKSLAAGILIASVRGFIVLFGAVFTTALLCNGLIRGLSSFVVHTAALGSDEAPAKEHFGVRCTEGCESCN